MNRRDIGESALVASLRRDLGQHGPRRIPRLPGFAFASVSIVVVSARDDARVVLIGRAVRRGDRWSGDVAFPGGMASDDDVSGLDTARREAREEVGLSLGDPIGTLSDRMSLAPGRTVPMRIRPFVFTSPEVEPFVPDAREVAAVYTPTFAEIDAAERTEVIRDFGWYRHRFEARVLGEHRLWGLTAGLLDELRRRVARGGI